MIPSTFTITTSATDRLGKDLHFTPVVWSGDSTLRASYQRVSGCRWLVCESNKLNVSPNRKVVLLAEQRGFST